VLVVATGRGFLDGDAAEVGPAAVVTGTVVAGTVVTGTVVAGTVVASTVVTGTVVVVTVEAGGGVLVPGVASRPESPVSLETNRPTSASPIESSVVPEPQPRPATPSVAVPSSARPIDLAP
jgi:hypothetical protein